MDGGLVDVAAAGVWVRDPRETFGGGGADLSRVDGLLKVWIPGEDFESVKDPGDGPSDGGRDGVDAAGVCIDEVRQLGRLFDR